MAAAIGLKSIRSVLAAAAAFAWAGAAVAQQLLLHFPLDGTPAVSGSAAGDSRLYLFDAGPAPTTVPGKYGSALHFTGKAAIAMPFKLDAATYPQVTVTAWVRLDPVSTGDRTIFSAGNGNVPRLMVNVDRNNFIAARVSLRAATPMPKDEWVFVAGTIDVAAARLENVQGEAFLSREGINVGNLYPPSSYRNPDDPSLPAMPYVFVGSHGFGQWRANGMAIDDVRVYAGVLTYEQIASVRNSSGAFGDSAAPSAAMLASSQIPEAAAGTGNLFQNEAPDIDQADRPPGPLDLSSASGTPSYQDGGLTDEDLAGLAARRAENAPPDIAYASEEEALAAEERRRREAEQSAESGNSNQTETRLPVPVGEMRFSGVAGHVGQNQRVFELEGARFLRAIGWAEGQDAPCAIWIADAPVADGTADGAQTLRLGCPGLIIPNLWAEGDPKRVRLETAVIGSIAVCNTSSSNRRLKGIRIRGSQINPDGSISYVPASDSAHQTNCDVWSSLQLCPVNPDYVATGLVVHSNDIRAGSSITDPNEEIVGLQLICRRVGLR